MVLELLGDDLGEQPIAAHCSREQEGVGCGPGRAVRAGLLLPDGLHHAELSGGVLDAVGRGGAGPDDLPPGNLPHGHEHGLHRQPEVLRIELAPPAPAMTSRRTRLPPTVLGLVLLAGLHLGVARRQLERLVLEEAGLVLVGDEALCPGELALLLDELQRFLEAVRLALERIGSDLLLLEQRSHLRELLALDAKLLVSTGQLSPQGRVLIEDFGESGHPLT